MALIIGDLKESALSSLSIAKTSNINKLTDTANTTVNDAIDNGVANAVSKLTGSSLPVDCIKKKTSGSSKRSNNNSKKPKKLNCELLIKKNSVKKAMKKKVSDKVLDRVTDKLNSTTVPAIDRSVLNNVNNTDCDSLGESEDFDFPSIDFNFPFERNEDSLLGGNNAFNFMDRLDFNMDFSLGSAASDDTACGDSKTATLNTLKKIGGLGNSPISKGFMKGLKSSGKLDLSTVSKVGDSVPSLSSMVDNSIIDTPTSGLNIKGNNTDRTNNLLGKIIKTKDFKEISKNNSLMEVVNKDSVMNTDIAGGGSMLASQRIKALFNSSKTKMSLVA